MLDSFFNHYHIEKSTSIHPSLVAHYKAYSCKSLTHSKGSKDLGFMKKYQQVCKIINYVCTPKQEYLQALTIKQIIQDIYQEYMQYTLTQGWKHLLSLQDHIHLQEYLLIKLIQAHPKISTFDQFLTKFFFTLNFLKTTNPQIKQFALFLDPKYSLSHFLLYLVLRTLSFQDDTCFKKINLKKFQKIIKILYKQQSSKLSIQNSINQSSHNSLSIEDRSLSIIEGLSILISLNKPLNKLSLYQLMKLSGLESQPQQIPLNWYQIYQQYFNNDQTQLKKIIAVQVCNRLHQLANLAFGKQQSLNKEGFLNEILNYNLELLNKVFTQKIDSQLGKIYQTIESLYNYQILLISKFIECILRQPFLLETIKKYS